MPTRTRPKAPKRPAAQPPAAAEREVVRDCLAYLRLRGVLAWRQNTGAFAGEYKGRRRFVRFGEPGMADIAGVITPRFDPRQAGRSIFVECKRPVGGRLSDDQRAFLDNARAAGALALVVTSASELAAMLDAASVPADTEDI